MVYFILLFGNLSYNSSSMSSLELLLEVTSSIWSKYLNIFESDRTLVIASKLANLCTHNMVLNVVNDIAVIHVPKNNLKFV